MQGRSIAFWTEVPPSGGQQKLFSTSNPGENIAIKENNLDARQAHLGQ